jgi:hypothetical protein
MVACSAESSSLDEVVAFAQFAFFRPHLAEMLGAFAAADLGLLVLKGAALAETVYDRPSRRPFGDLDVLLRPVDTPRAKLVLETLGYGVDPRVWNDLLRQRDCQANFFKHTERGPVVVELHTDLLNNPLFRGTVPIADESLWERAQPACLAGTEAWVLGPEDQLLHLCLHLACHYFAAPQSHRDIAQVCAAQPIDWPLLVTLARQARASSTCFGALLAAAHCHDAVIPASVLDELAPRSPRRRLCLASLALAACEPPLPTLRQRLPLLWCLLEGHPKRSKAFRRILFPSRRWLTEHYAEEVAEGWGGGAALGAAHARFLWRSVVDLTRRQAATLP